MKKFFLILIFSIFALSFVFSEDVKSNSISENKTNVQNNIDEQNLDNSYETNNSSSAVSDDEEWYVNKTIAGFNYIGNNRINNDRLNAILSKYIGLDFTYDRLDDILNSLYELEDTFSSIIPEADTDQKGDLIIILKFSEIPMLGKISFSGNKHISEGAIKSFLTMKEGKPFFYGDLRNGEREIEKEYIKNGYKDIKVSVSSKDNDENNTVDVFFQINEGAQSKVTEFEFIGNYSFTDADVVRAINKEKDVVFLGSYFNEQYIPNNVNAIINFYKKNGFVDIAVTTSNPQITAEDENGNLSYRITFNIFEGRQWRIEEVKFQGVEKLDENRLRGFVSQKPNDIVDYDIISSDYEKIQGEYYDNGFIYATFNIESIKDDTKSTITPIYVINEGQQAIVEDIKIEGNIKTKDFVFLREVTLEKGDIFSRAKLIKSLQNIYNTTIVGDVNYKLIPGEKDGNLVVEFDVKESKQMDLTFGLTFGGNNTGFPISLLVSVSDKNFLGNAMRLTAGVQINSDYQAVNLSWGDGWVGNKRWSNSVSFQFEHSYKTDVLQKDPDQSFLYGRNRAYPFGYTSYEEWQAKRETLPSSQYLMNYHMFRLSVGWNSGYTWVFDAGRLSLSGGITFGLNKVNYNQNEFVPYEYLIYKYGEAWQFSNNLSFNITWDGRDFIENTTAGYLISENITYAGGFLGGLSNYIKSQTSLAGYISIFKVGSGFKPRALVLSISTNLGLMLPQFWSCAVDSSAPVGWAWHDPKYGATRNEMLYIDGMRVSRGTDSVYDLSFIWDNMVELSFPIAVDIVNFEVFTSLTAAAPELNVKKPLAITWYGAIGAGIKLKITGFPLGLYFVGNYSFASSSPIEWKTGGIFNYVRPVLAISTSLF